MAGKTEATIAIPTVVASVSNRTIRCSTRWGRDPRRRYPRLRQSAGFRITSGPPHGSAVRNDTPPMIARFPKIDDARDSPA